MLNGNNNSILIFTNYKLHILMKIVISTLQKIKLAVYFCLQKNIKSGKPRTNTSNVNRTSPQDNPAGVDG